jgi:hypothetical protein
MTEMSLPVGRNSSKDRYIVETSGINRGKK